MKSTGCNAKKTRVIVADDNAAVRESVISLLQQEASIQVIAEAEDGREVEQLARRLDPDLVIMDLIMPLTNGIEAIGHIKRRNERSKVIALTAHDAGAFVCAALGMGADGYVLKQDGVADLIKAIDKVMSGKCHLSPRVAKYKARDYYSLRPCFRNTGGKGSSWETLTKREREIARLMADGKRKRAISDSLGISVKSVKRCRLSLMRKLDIRGPSELKAYIVRNRLVG